MKNLYTFVEPAPCQFPGFISVNDEAGTVTVSVRSRGAMRSSGTQVPREHLEALHAALGEFLGLNSGVDGAVLTQLPISVTVNGRKLKLTSDVGGGPGTIIYADLCKSADKDPVSNPTVTYSLPDGRCGSIINGQFAPLERGAVYNVMITGNA